MPRYSPISTPNSTACRSAFQRGVLPNDGWESLPLPLSCSGVRPNKEYAPREASGMADGNSAQSLGRRSHLMGRRELILLLGGAVTAPRALRAQQKAMPVIGYFGVAAPSPYDPRVAAFHHQGLSETGYGRGWAVKTRSLSPYPTRFGQLIKLKASARPKR